MRRADLFSIGIVLTLLGMPGVLHATSLTHMGQLRDVPGLRQWLHAEPYDFTSARGSIVILGFWTTGSRDGMRQVSILERMWRTLPKDDTVRVLAIHEPHRQADRSLGRVREAAFRSDLTLPIAQDTAAGARDALGVLTIPTVIIADDRGVIRWRGEGLQSLTTIREVIDLLRWE